MVYPPIIFLSLWCCIWTTNSPFNTSLHISQTCLCMCVFLDGCCDRPIIRQEGCVCWVVSFLEGWLIRTSWGCEGCVIFVVSRCAIKLSSCSTTLSWCCEEGKETCAVLVKSCCACTREPLSECSLSMWLGFRCLPASVNSKNSHQCFSQQQEGSWTSHTRAHSAAANQPAIWSGDQLSVAWEIYT